MTPTSTAHHDHTPRRENRRSRLGLAVGLLAVTACAGSGTPAGGMAGIAPTGAAQPLRVTAPTPDPRVGLRAGLFDAQEAIWNLSVVSKTPPPEPFVGVTNSDLAFKGNYVIQGNYDGVQIWDISNPASPTTVITYVCPASQSDVSVYGDLLFVSGEGMTGRLDWAAKAFRKRSAIIASAASGSSTSRTSGIPAT